MPRYRPGQKRWIHAACVVGAYLVVVAGLFTLQLGAGLHLPVSLALAAPPLVYAALAVVLVREASLVRRLSWIGGACLLHVVLGALAATQLTLAGALSLAAAFAQVFVLFPPAPLLTMVATPMTLVAFGVNSTTATRHPTGAARPSVAPRPRPMPAAAHAGHGAPEAPPAPRPALPLRAGAATAPSAPRPTPPPVVPSPPPAAAVANVQPAATPDPPPVQAKSPRRVDDGMVRVSFGRIAAQLPAEAFVLPFDRLGESLREPHVVLVPRRVVLSELRDGAVAVTWAHIASQFPDLALGLSNDEFRKQYPDLKVWLPIDELESQLPPGSIAASTAGPLLIDTAPTARPSSNGVAAHSSAPATVPTADPAVPVPPRMDLVGRDVVTAIATCFGDVGSFECAAERVGDTPAIMLVVPGLPREAVQAAAGSILRMVAGVSADVVTFRAAHAVVVMAVASTPIVVAARRPGAPVALLGLRARRAAGSLGDGVPSRSPSALRALEPVGGAEGRVIEAARLVRSLAGVEPRIFADGEARVYVLGAGGTDGSAAAALGLELCRSLGNAGDLGRPRDVVFRRGEQHTLIRPLAGGGVLVVTGAVTRPGRFFREVDRAATVLEAM